jgi:hypothetical protein
MMDMEISNKTLAWLVVAVIFVSLGGTLMSVYRIGNGGVTGFASSNRSGNATVTVTSSTTLNFAVSALNFGSGTVDGSSPPYSCNLTSNGTISSAPLGNAIVQVGGCSGFNNWTNASGASSNWLQIENIGNTLLNVSLNFSSGAPAFIGGGAQPNAPLPTVLFDVYNNDTNACSDLNVSYIPWTNVTGPGQVYNVCWGNSGLQTGANNSMGIGIKLVIPYDATTGSQRVLAITASGSD